MKKKNRKGSKKDSHKTDSPETLFVRPRGSRSIDYKSLIRDTKPQITEDKMMYVPADSIVCCSQNPRTDFDRYNNRDQNNELEDSIIEMGILEPLVVISIREVDADLVEKSFAYTKGLCPHITREDVKYLLVNGERRLRSIFRKYYDYIEKFGQIPIVIKHLDDPSRLAAMFVENATRVKVNPIDEAKHLKRLFEHMKKANPNATQADLAQKVSLSTQKVGSRLRLLTLPEDLQKRIYEGRLSPPQAEVLAKIPDRATRERMASLRLKTTGDKWVEVVKDEIVATGGTITEKREKPVRPVDKKMLPKGPGIWTDKTRPGSCICHACVLEKCPNHPGLVTT